MLGWWLVDIGDKHVIPREDLVDHICREDCVCGPTQELVSGRGDSPDCWMYTHHSLDGRELTEPDR